MAFKYNERIGAVEERLRTAVKRSEEEARTAQAATLAATDELRDFAYAMSHDMKAPANTLNMLLSELSRLTAGQLDAEATEVLEMGQATVARMQGLVEDVLDYTRIIGMAPVHGPVCLKAPRGLHEVVPIMTAAELHDACLERFPAADVTIIDPNLRWTVEPNSFQFACDLQFNDSFRFACELTDSAHRLAFRALFDETLKVLRVRECPSGKNSRCASTWDGG